MLKVVMPNVNASESRKDIRRMNLLFEIHYRIWIKSNLERREAQCFPALQTEHDSSGSGAY